MKLTSDCVEEIIGTRGVDCGIIEKSKNLVTMTVADTDFSVQKIFGECWLRTTPLLSDRLIFFEPLWEYMSKGIPKEFFMTVTTNGHIKRINGYYSNLAK